jgi:hypothetical protein
MSPDDLATTYRIAERRLRDALPARLLAFTSPASATARTRQRVSRELRQMREALDAALLEDVVSRGRSFRKSTGPALELCLPRLHRLAR